jgi:hypothetical protein
LYGLLAEFRRIRRSWQLGAACVDLKAASGETPRFVAAR